EPQYAGLPTQRVWTIRSMAVGDGLRVFLRVHGRRDRPVDALPVPRSYADLPMDWKIRLQPHHRPGRRSDQARARSPRGRTGTTVLRLLCARRHSLTAPAEAGVGGEVQRQIRYGL